VPEAAARPTLILAATVLASAMAFIDGSVVTIALPVIQSEMRASFQGLQWVVNAYTLPLGALILVGGGMGDRLGRKRIFLAGIVIFALASLLCAAAPSLAVLIAGRALQGVGGALLVPQSLAIISASFPREVRGRAIGVWAAASAITTSLGPPIGGFLIDALSWRVAFWINLPLSVAALWLTYAYVPESRDHGATGRLDWAGSALAALSLGALTYGLSSLSDGAPRPMMIAGTLALAVVGLLAFWRVEAVAANPIMPFGLFQSRTFLIANIFTLFLYGALAAVLFLLPFDLIERRGMPASAVGIVLLPFGLIIGLLSRFSGGLSDRHGARLFLVGGALLAGVGAAWLAVLSQSFWAGVMAPVLLMAFGMAAIVSPLTTVVMNAAPDHRSGAASGVNNAASRVAGLLAIAIIGAIAGLLFAYSGAPASARFGELPASGDPGRAALEAPFAAGYSGAMLVAAAWCFIAAAAAFFWLGDERPKRAAST
jgi:EmrB/QacA subfamily drug resistance transporter